MILRPGVAVFESRAAARMSSAVLWSGRRATLVDPDRDSEHRLVVGEVWKMRAGVDRGVPG